MELITPGLGLIFWMTISFGIVFFILSKLAWKPIMKALRERESSIEDSLRSADIARNEMKQLKVSNEQLIKEAKEERDALMREARKVKESIIEEAKEKAKEEANRIIDSAHETIRNEKQAAITELKNQVASLSILIAEKILKQELESGEKQKQLIDSWVNDIKIN